jgi:flagellar M-ring protein FliF
MAANMDTPANGSPPGGDTSSDLRRRLGALSTRYTHPQKAAAVLIALAVVAGVLLMTRIATSAQYEPLFTDLAAADAADITEQLNSEGVPYELADGGHTILVPSEQVYDARLKVSADGLPSDSKVGYGVLDDQGLTTSEFGQRVGFQRAMEGELADTIEALDVVDTATVHLALPDDSAFALDEQEATASVLVRTESGEVLGDDQVQAVINLVASGIENLSPDDVTVADAEGNVLAAPGQGPVGSAGAGGRQKQTEQFERSVATSIEEMLAAIAGPGATRATVAADLNFDESNVSRETFAQPTPGTDGTPLALEDSTRTETYTGSAPGSTGVLGAETPGAATSGGPTDYSMDEAEVSYAIDRVVESTNTAPGAINRLSVAVVVDEDKVTEAMTADVTALVSAGAGISTERGDTLAVTRMPFDTSSVEQADKAMEEAEKAEEAAASQKMIQNLGLIVFLVIVLLVAFFLYRRAAKQRHRRAQLLAELQMEAGMLPVPLGTTSASPAMAAASSVQDLSTAPRANSSTSALGGSGATGTAVLDPPATAGMAQIEAPEGDRGRMHRQDEISQMVEQQPDEVAQMVRGWLGDGRGGSR